MKTPNELMMDGAGRIVLPQPVRRHFHLTRGSTLDMDIQPEAIVLRPHTRQAGLTEDAGLLVHEGTPTGDLLNAVADSRQRRDLQAAGGRL